jgi:hypothetical protein
MAITRIKSTYALDVSTVKALEEMAVSWNVSKSEALRRAIRSAAAREPERCNGALEALEDLQQALALTPTKARTWAGRVRKERRASMRSEARAE